MARLINLIINNCNECPYHDYDPKYGMSYNSGYDCNLSGRRIVEDVGSKTADLTTLSIPSWCELKEVDEKVYRRKEKINKILDNSKL